jgi:CDGSH-type Zn-finger protein
VATSNEALVAQRGPFAVELCAGKTYAWCACGRSSSQPFCDGSHKETGLVPVVFKAERDGTAYLCGCKTSQGRPFCDGSHNRL